MSKQDPEFYKREAKNMFMGSGLDELEKVSCSLCHHLAFPQLVCDMITITPTDIAVAAALHCATKVMQFAIPAC